MRFVSAGLLSFLVLLAPALALAAVDINTASESQLDALPGIGPKKAKDIIAERQANGPFKSIDDLRRVKGIGDKTVADLRAQVTVDSPPAAPGATSNARDSPAAAAKFPSAWVIVVVVAAGGIGWFLLRRRSTASGGSATPPQRPSASALPKQAPTTPSAQPATSAAPPPAPAGPKPAGQPAARPAGSGGAPPAPAGARRKDS